MLIAIETFVVIMVVLQKATIYLQLVCIKNYLKSLMFTYSVFISKFPTSNNSKFENLRKTTEICKKFIKGV